MSGCAIATIILWVIFYVNIVAFCVKLFSQIGDDTYMIWLLSLFWPAWVWVIGMWYVLSSPYWFLKWAIKFDEIDFKKVKKNGQDKSVVK